MSRKRCTLKKNKAYLVHKQIPRLIKMIFFTAFLLSNVDFTKSAATAKASRPKSQTKTHILIQMWNLNERSRRGIDKERYEDTYNLVGLCQFADCVLVGHV